jgi:hypothetical protein
VLAAIGGAATIFTKDMRLEVGGMVINELHKYAVTAVGTSRFVVPPPQRSLCSASYAVHSLTRPSFYIVALFSLYWSESFQPLFVTVAIAGVRT